MYCKSRHVTGYTVCKHPDSGRKNYSIFSWDLRFVHTCTDPRPSQCYHPVHKNTKIPQFEGEILESRLKISEDKIGIAEAKLSQIVQVCMIFVLRAPNLKIIFYFYEIFFGITFLSFRVYILTVLIFLRFQLHL